MRSIEETIKTEAQKAGYEACGIIKADFFEQFMTYLEERSALFPHAAAYYENYKGMADPRERTTWGQSIVVCVRRYDKYKIPGRLEKYIGKYFIFDGEQSYSKEHAGKAAFEQFLKQLGFQAEPVAVPKRWAAVKAGLGKFRNNTFFYTLQGSWNSIDTWIVDQKLEYEKNDETTRYACPENCNRCIEACPTGALSAPMKMDATRCVAYLTYKSASLPEEALREKMGTYIYGCDACQNACPANRWDGMETFAEPSPLEELMALENILSMDGTAYLEKLNPRFGYIGKDKFWQWKCNVIRAMANEDPRKYSKYFTQALEDSNENVKEIALWALNKTK